MKRLTANLLLVFGSLAVALLAAEVLSRLLVPLDFADATTRVEVAADGGRMRHATTREYDKHYNETAARYRAPAVTNPEMLFIGDSFTYGIGLDDQETIPTLYCLARGLRCANLGEPGSGTGAQIVRLRRFLDERGWRPKEVRLLVLAMTNYLGAGNDLLDNLAFAEMGEPGLHAPAIAGDQGAADDAEATVAQSTSSFAERLVALRGSLLRHSNLARVVYYQLGPQLRATFSPAPERERLQQALALTGEYMAELDALSRTYGFDYEVVVIHPMQDLMNNSDGDTLAALAPLVPNGRLVGTRDAFGGNPQAYYYAFDGHLNPQGAAAVAAFLAQRDEGL